MPEKPRPNLIQGKHAEMIAARRFFLLFVFLLLTLVLYPYTEGYGSRYYLLRFLGSAVVVLSVYAISFRRGLLLIAGLLAIPALLGRIVMYEFDASALSVIRIFLNLTFDTFIVVVIFRRVFSHQKPNAETVFGALCIYLLVGFGFTSIYGLISSFDPVAFHLDPATNLHTVPDRFDFIYYSFGTITSLGAAGITPVSGEARSLTVIEGILGVLYLAVLISRLMGAYRGHEAPEQKPQPPIS
jgi:Ion channel